MSARRIRAAEQWPYTGTHEQWEVLCRVIDELRNELDQAEAVSDESLN